MIISKESWAGSLLIASKGVAFQLRPARCSSWVTPQHSQFSAGLSRFGPAGTSSAPFGEVTVQKRSGLALKVSRTWIPAFSGMTSEGMH
jgi:hypothetical protein